MIETLTAMVKFNTVLDGLALNLEFIGEVCGPTRCTQNELTSYVRSAEWLERRKDIFIHDHSKQNQDKVPFPEVQNL